MPCPASPRGWRWWSARSSLAALIGLSRVLLSVHYLSDVLAGWGLSAAIFAGLGLVAMIVAYIRHNGERA